MDAIVVAGCSKIKMGSPDAYLIDAWRASAGAPRRSVNEGANGVVGRDGYLLRIADPAVRTLAQRTLVERNMLRAELNLLKAQAVLQIDLRPAPVTRVASAGLALTPSEISALERSVSQEFLRDEGWREGENGEIANARGRKVFDVGFARAIRKVLALAKLNPGPAPLM